jgi:hypothetical protein
MAEVNYYWALPDNTRLVPKLTFDWMRTYTDAFTEIGGTTPISGSAVTASRIRMLIGGELGHSWLVDRRIMDASVYARFVDNLSQNFGALQISDTTGVNLPAFVAGIRESTLGADAGAALSAKVTDVMRPLHRLRRPLPQQSHLAQRNGRRRIPLVGCICKTCPIRRRA